MIDKKTKVVYENGRLTIKIIENYMKGKDE